MQMTEKFDAHICPIQHYSKYKRAPYTLAIIQFDIVQDGIPFDNGYNGRYECCDVGLKELVEAADDFLAGRITENEILSFEIPYIVGGFIRYGYFFEIFVGKNPEDNYWVFKVTPNFSAEKREIKYSCVVSREQVAALRESLAHQIEDFDWANCGKTEFFRFDLPDKPYEWCYSAKQLETELNRLFVGDRLETIYVSGTNFADPLRVRENFVNYYVGSRVYLEFEKTHADILAHACGLFEIRVFDARDVTKTRFYDELDDADKVLCDTGYVFQLNYTGKTVRHIDVKATDCWPWDARGFDESKVGNPIEVPESLHFTFENNTRLTIAGWDDDFMIKMESIES